MGPYWQKCSHRHSLSESTMTFDLEGAGSRSRRSKQLKNAVFSLFSPTIPEPFILAHGPLFEKMFPTVFSEFAMTFDLEGAESRSRRSKPMKMQFFAYNSWMVHRRTWIPISKNVPFHMGFQKPQWPLTFKGHVKVTKPKMPVSRCQARPVSAVAELSCSRMYSGHWSQYITLKKNLIL